ncbi:hypothetical protein PIB30_092515, partial [Stylosanthes scabra]|nr:hypothetical protein [Stylosanthes scabra]
VREHVTNLRCRLARNTIRFFTLPMALPVMASRPPMTQTLTITTLPPLWTLLSARFVNSRRAFLPCTSGIFHTYPLTFLRIRQVHFRHVAQPKLRFK